jgi:hypothetical protein
VNNEEALGIVKRFSLGIVERYLGVGQPPHESVVALVCVNPDDPDDAYLWIGDPSHAREEMVDFPEGQNVIDELLLKVPAAPLGMLKVFVFSENGGGAGYLATTPRAQA